MDFKIGPGLRVYLILVFVFLLFTPAALQCSGSYLGGCTVELTCHRGDTFFPNEIYVKDNDRRITCDLSGSGQDFDSYYSYLDFKLTYKEKDHGVIPYIDNFRDSIIHELDVSFNEYKITPSFYRMEKLYILNLTGNLLTEAKMFNEEPLPSLRKIDYSHNLINSFNYESGSGFYAYNELTHLNISNNLLNKIDQRLFRFLDNLIYLDLSYNKIDTLEVMSFDGLTKLKKLDLTANHLKNCALTLRNLGELEELYLGNNKIETINVGEFENLNKIKILILNSNFLVNIENNDLKGMNLLETIDMKNNSLEKVSKNIFEGMDFIKNVDLSYNNIEVLGRNVFKGKNVSSFAIEGNKLKGTIGKGMFEGLTLVKKIDLSNQNLTEVQDNTFYALENLIYLNLSNNFVANLAKFSFRTLRNLLELDLSNNRIINIDFDKLDLISLESLKLHKNFIQQLKPNDFVGLGVLQQLTLFHNNISTAERGVFQPLQELISLDLSQNPLSGNIETNLLDGLNSLTYLDISQTLLSEIKNGSFHGLESIQHLNLSRNSLINIGYDIFRNAENLELIDLSYNKLNKFHLNSKHFLNLKELYLSNNILEDIGESDFNELSKLSVLSLSRNSIATIDPKAFYKLMELQNLDLSFNSRLIFNGSAVENNKKLEILSLSGIENKTKFSDMSHLPINELQLVYCNVIDLKRLNLSELGHISYLDISHNSIDTVKVNIFDSLTNLRLLDLSYNKILFIQPGSFKSNLYLNTLNVSHNNLSTIKYGTFRGMRYVETIDLSYNNIKELKGEQFVEVPSLNRLIVDANQIEAIDSSKFSQLEILSLGDNALLCQDISQLRDFFGQLVVTAMRIDYHTENSEGITCHQKTNAQHTDTQISEKTVYDNHSYLNIVSVLEDIRRILLQNSDKAPTNVLPSSDSTNSNLDLANAIISQIKNFSLSANERILDIDEIKDISSNTNRTNVLLNRLLDIMTLTAQTPIKSATNLGDNLNGNSKNDLENYVNSIKKEFDLKNMLDHNKLLDLEEKLASMTSRLEKLAILNKNSTEVKNEKLVAEKTPVVNVQNNTFTEVCVSFILIILVAIVLYKLYDSGKILRSRRTASTRRITESIESANL